MAFLVKGALKGLKCTFNLKKHYLLTNFFFLKTCSLNFETMMKLEFVGHTYFCPQSRGL